MKQQEVFNKISGIIKELNDQFKYLEADQDKINELELELFLANTHFLAGYAGILRKLNIQDNAAKLKEKKAKGEEKYFEPLIHQPGPASKDQPVPHIDIASGTPGDDYSYIRQEPEIIKHELEIDESWIDAEEVPDEDEAPDEPEMPAMEPEPEVIAEKPVDEKQKTVKQDEEVLTINQKISAQLGNKAAAESSIQPLSDLKSAITLNDRMLYVKDLFNGYSLAYNEAIDILNRFNSFEEADNYLKSNYAAKNHWADKPETVEKLYGLLKRRYS
jgi:hypothetical protein